ncbi:helix-turn-helix domain-containing protein [Streptomyces virginiae]|uniref:helix-turn-helix transcriptional regulator n=1 Tax=Streptomyces virginiae TaxID=1961 RepID=UPI003415C1C8
MPRSRTRRPAVPAAQDRLLTARETAARLGVSPKTLYRWASCWGVERRGPMPVRMDGGLVRWPESVVTAYIADLIDGA